MNEYLKIILLGVPSGVVSAFVVWVVISLFRNTILPWYRQYVYKGVEIEGEWIYSSEQKSVTNTFKLNIEKQLGHELSGWFSQDYKDGSELRHGRYKFNGEVVDGFVVLSLFPSNRNKSTFGTIHVQIKGSGNKLEGVFTYKNTQSDDITSTTLTLEKEQR